MNKSGGISLNVQPLSAAEQAMELKRTVKCKLAPSKIHGVGVVAIRDIKKGERVYVALTEKPTWYNISHSNLKKHFVYENGYPEIYDLIMDRWPQVVNGAPFISPNYDARLMSFTNHSDTPNYDPDTDTALEDIKAGDEITQDYREMENYEKAFPWLSV